MAPTLPDDLKCLLQATTGNEFKQMLRAALRSRQEKQNVGEPVSEFTQKTVRIIISTVYWHVGQIRAQEQQRNFVAIVRGLRLAQKKAITDTGGDTARAFCRSMWPQDEAANEPACACT